MQLPWEENYATGTLVAIGTGTARTKNLVLTKNNFRFMYADQPFEAWNAWFVKVGDNVTIYRNLYDLNKLRYEKR